MFSTLKTAFRAQEIELDHGDVATALEGGGSDKEEEQEDDDAEAVERKAREAEEEEAKVREAFCCPFLNSSGNRWKNSLERDEMGKNMRGFQLRAAAEKTRQEQLQQLKTQEVGFIIIPFLYFPVIASLLFPEKLASQKTGPSSGAARRA